MLTISGLGVSPFLSTATKAITAMATVAPTPSMVVSSFAPAPPAPPAPAPPLAPLLCPDGVTQVTNLAMCPTTAPYPTNTQTTPGIAPSGTPTSYTCSDGITIVSDPSMCPAAMAATAAASTAATNAATTGIAPTAQSTYICPDGVTQVTDPSQCPQAMPAPGSSTGMQLTPTVAPPTTAPSPMMSSMGPVFLCSDGITQVADPSLCPQPTILGINQTAFLWGAAAIAVGVGAFLFLKK
jgi:hypothetical protein